MRRGPTIAALLVLAAALSYWVLSTREREEVGATSAVPAAGSEPPSAAPPVLAAPQELDAAPVRERAEQASAAAPAPTEVAPACVVLGRVVDEHSAPLPGAEIRLFAFKSWATGLDVPRLPGKHDFRGWSTPSDADGRFRFEVPVPSAESTSLTITPDVFHDSARITFGGERGEAKPALRAGTVDLGTLTLATTGAIRGRVLDKLGQPIEGAELTVGAERSNTIGRTATTLADGGFLIGHVPPGTYGVNAKHAGHLSEFRKPLTIEPRRHTEAGDFLLADAPVLSGVVVDPAGAPVAGAKLWGWPSTSGQGAGGKSADDGTFTILLPQDEPYSLGATCEGYDAVSDNRSTVYAPGTTAIRIVMQRAAALAVLVLDEESGQPLEEFGYGVLLDNSSHSPRQVFTERRKPRALAHPGGRADIAFRAGKDLVVVAAPGHCTATIDLEPGQPVERPHVVRLARSASVAGVCVEQGSPAVGAAVRLERGLDWSHEAFRADRGNVATSSTAADGAFRFDDVEPGRYRVVAQAASGAARMSAPFQVRAGQPVQLGRIELEASATIAGRILLPPGRALAGRTVRLDDPFVGPTAVTDAGGRFRFERVPAGTHTVRLEEVPGEFDETKEQELDLAAGEIRDLLLDASGLGTCDVRLVIRFGERPMQGLQVSLRTGASLTLAQHVLGRTAEDGSVRGFVPVASGYRVEVWGYDIGRLSHPTARLEAVLDGRIDETVVFELGSLAIEWPATVAPPEGIFASITLSGTAGESSWNTMLIGRPGATQSQAVDLAARRVHLAYVPLGEWNLTFELSSADAQPVMTAVSPNTWTTKRPVLYTGEAELRVTAGTVTRVRLE